VALKDSKKNKENWGLVQKDKTSELQRDLTKKNPRLWRSDWKK